MRISSLLHVAIALTLTALPVQAAAEEARTQTTALSPGMEALDGKGLEPFVARYQELSLDQPAKPNGRERSTRLDKLVVRGQEAVRFGITMIGREASVYDEIQMLSDGLVPVMRIVSAPTILHKIEVFEGGTMKGIQITKDASAAESMTIQPKGPRFSGGTADLILSTLQLEKGMQIEIPTFSSDMGEAMANLITRATVNSKTTLQAANRSWDVWIVDLEQLDESGKPLELPNGASLPKARIWLSDQAPYTIRTEWRPGMAIELIEVE